MTPIKSGYMMFSDRLFSDAAHMPGWVVEMESSYGYDGMMNVRFLCPHGALFVECISFEVVTSVYDPMQIADQYFMQAVHRCVGQHLDQPLGSWQQSLLEDYKVLVGSLNPMLSYFAQPMQGQVAFGNGAIKNPIYDELIKLVPTLDSTNIQCPECSIDFVLGGVIPHLNDSHEWTRDHIADWLETLDVDLTIQSKKGIECQAQS